MLNTKTNDQPGIKKKKVAMRNGGTESKGVKKEKFNPQNGGEDRNDIDGGKHHDRYNSTSIFVSNLAYKTSVEDLKNHMCAAGNVNQVKFCPCCYPIHSFFNVGPALH